MKIKLNIRQNQQVKTIDLKEQNVNHLPFESQSAYQLVDENNQIIEPIYWKKQDGDILFFLNPNDTQPILVLHDGHDFLAAVHFPQVQPTPLTQAVQASEVASMDTNWALLGLGGVAFLGAGLALAKKGSSSDNPTPAVENQNNTQNNQTNTQDLEIAKQQLAQAQQAQQQAESHQARLEAALRKANSDLENALRDKRWAENALQNAQNSGNQNLTDLQRQLNQANQAVKNAETAKQNAEKALADLRSQLAQSETGKTRLETELNNANSAKTQAESALQQANSDLANALREKQLVEDALNNAQNAQNTSNQTIADLQKQLDDTNQTVQNAEKALADLRSQLAQSETDKTRLETELNQANSDLANALREKQLLEDTLNNAQNAQNTSNQTITDLQKQLDDANQTVQNAEKALAELRSQLAQSETDKTRLETELNNANSAKTQAETALQQANSDLANALREKQLLEDALNNAQNAQNTSNQTIADLQKQLTDANQTVQNAEKALADLRSQLAQSETDKNNANADKARLETELNQANSDLANALREKQLVEDALKNAQNTQNTSNQTIADLQKQLDDANQTVQNAEKALADLRSQLTQSETDKTRLETELNQANSAKTQAESALQQANSDLANALLEKQLLEDALKNAQNAQNTSNQTIADLQKQLDDANKSVQNAEKALADLRSQLAQSETDKNNANADKARLENELNQANSDLANALREKQLLEDALKNAQNAQNTSNQTIADLQKQLDDANQAVQNAEKALADLRSQLAQSETDKTRLETELNNANSAKTQAETNLQNVQRELQNALDDKNRIQAEKNQIAQDLEQALNDKNTDTQRINDLQNQLNNVNQTLANKEQAVQDAQKAKTAAETQRDAAIEAQKTAEKALADFQAAQAEAIKNNPPQIRFNDLTEDNIINSSETTSEIEISGSVNNMQPNDVLTIKIGDTSHPVSVEQGNFVLKINGNILAGKPVVLAEITRDGEKVAEKSHTYDVDTQIDTPVITFNPITADNIIQLNESREKAIEISGKVQHFQQGEQLSIKIGDDAPKRLAIQDDGSFSFWLSGEKLAQKPTIQATLTTQDVAKNTATTVAEAQYTVEDSTPTPTTIQFDDLTGDNHINVTEKSQEITLTGTVSGSHAATHKGKEVTLTVNGKPLTATVGDDLRFAFKIMGDDLIKQPNYTLSASLNENGNVISTPEKTYTVAPDAIAKINLDDVNLNLGDDVGRLRLTGKLDLSNSLFGQGKNGNLIRAVVLKIGEKTFNVAVERDTHEFHLDLSQAEYQALKGNSFSHELKYYNDTYAYNQNIGFPYTEKIDGYPDKYRMVRTVGMDSELVKTEIGKVYLTFEKEPWVHMNHQLDLSNDEAQTTVSGSVQGAKSGDTVRLEVGNKQYQARVGDDLRFSVKVKNADLNASKTIQAHLQTQNGKGEQISVSDMGNVLQKTDVASTFVNPHQAIAPNDRVVQHTDSKYNFPYFIHAIDKNAYSGYLNLNKTPFGTHGKATPVLKYYFATQKDYDNGLTSAFTNVETGSYADFSTEMKDHLRYVYETFGKVANLKFEEATSKDEADAVLMTAKFKEASSGFAYFGGQVIFNSNYGFGEFKKHINFHEILHTLGGKHTDADPTDPFRLASYATGEMTTEASIMSYNYNFSTNSSGRNDLGVYDLAYLHYRFGVNQERNTGNDVYRFNTYNPMSMDGNVYIWDASGVDTFDASKETEGVNVNLTPGSWIYRGEKTDTFLIKERITTQYNNHEATRTYFPEFGADAEFYGVYFRQAQNVYAEGQAFIGFGTQIENLVGSAHHDVLQGNKADNNIYGGDGVDVIAGDDGNDYLDGGSGNDVLVGGLGNDIYVVDSASDQITEMNNQGTDTVYAHVNYRLSDFVENLSLFGNAMTGDGNALNNIIQGNDLNNTLNGEAGNDRLDGGRGSDTLTGGDGADTFVFSALLDGAVDTITDFTLSQDKIELALNVFAGLTAGNLAEHIKYDQATGALSYDADGAGNADAIHFATLQNKVDLKMDETHFILA